MILLFLKFEADDDDHGKNNQETGYHCDWEDEIGYGQKQSTVKEEFGFGKCQGIFSTY